PASEWQTSLWLAKASPVKGVLVLSSPVSTMNTSTFRGFHKKSSARERFLPRMSKARDEFTLRLGSPGSGAHWPTAPGRPSGWSGHDRAIRRLDKNPISGSVTKGDRVAPAAAPGGNQPRPAVHRAWRRDHREGCP